MVKQAKKKTLPPKTTAEQIAALPYRNRGKNMKIALVTSRETKRWVIPKGWLDKGVRPQNMAKIEAFEEAGLEGNISKQSIGTYHYDKILDDGTPLPCTVTVYGLKVKTEHKQFKEADERDVQWFTPQEAADNVDEDDLAALILHFQSSLKKAA